MGVILEEAQSPDPEEISANSTSPNREDEMSEVTIPVSSHSQTSEEVTEDNCGDEVNLDLDLTTNEPDPELEQKSNMITLKREKDDLLEFEFDPSWYVRTTLTPEEPGDESTDLDDSSRGDDSDQPSTEEDECLSPILVAKNPDAEAGEDGTSEEKLDFEFPVPADDESGIITLVGRPVLEHILEMRRGLDTIITLKDGKVGAHRMVLTAASPYLGEMLLDQNSKGKATLVIPDVTTKTMERLLNLAYTGKMFYTQEESEEIFSAMQCLYFAEFADLSVVRVVKVEKPACSFQTTGFLGPIPEELPLEIPEEMEYTDSEMDTTSASHYTCMDERTMRCNLCSKTYTAQKNLIHHLETAHACVVEKITFEEMQKLTNCSICNVQWKTLDRAQKHLLTKHDCNICWTCLEPVIKKDMKSHYYSCHRNDINSPSTNFSVQCRWCSRSLKIGTNNNCNAIGFHAQLHMQSLQTSKRGAGRPSNNEAFNFKVPQGRAPKRHIQGGKPERILGKMCAPPEYRVDEVTGKCRIDLNNLPNIAIQLKRLTQDAPKKYNTVTPNANPGSSKLRAGRRSSSTMSRRDSSGPGQLLSIDPIYEAGYEDMNGLRLSDDIFPEHFLFATETPTSTSDPDTIAHVKKRLAKRRKTGPDPDSAGESTLALLTQAWGQLRFAVHNLSESLSPSTLKGNFIPVDGILMVGRVAPDFIWDKIDNMEIPMNVSILRLIPDPSEEEKYMELHKFLSSTNRLGVLSGAYPPEISDVYLYALNSEGYNRESMLRFHGPGFSEAEGHATSLLIVSIHHVPGDSKPGPEIKKVAISKAEPVTASDSALPYIADEISDEKLRGEPQALVFGGNRRISARWKQTKLNFQKSPIQSP